VFILAHRDGERGQLPHWWRLTAEQMPKRNGTPRENVWPSRPGQPQHGWEPPQVVGDTESQRSAALRTEHEGLGWELRAASASSQGVVGDTDCRRQSPDVVAGGCSKEVGRGQGDLEPTDLGQTQPALGRDAHGPSRRLDYAELCVTCDNRTDQLRLLGNGVVPATAELAFRTLMAQLDAANS
jgi:hypothetical protein